MLSLGYVLKSVRKKHGLSQEELADRIGVHRNIIYRAELRPESMKLGLFLRIAKATGEDFWKMLKHIEKGENAPTRESAANLP